MSGTYRGGEARLGNGRTVVLAEPERRYGARLLDMVVLLPAVVMVAQSLIFFSFAALGGNVEQRLLGLGGVVGLWVLVLYEPVMVARWGATVGKRAVGIRVVCFADGGWVSYRRSWLRVLLPCAAGVLTLGVGWLVVMLMLAASMTSGRDWRGWHDRLAGTVVVNAPRTGAGAELEGRRGLTERGEVHVAAGGGVLARAVAWLVDAVCAAPFVVWGTWSVLGALENYGVHHLHRGNATYSEAVADSAFHWVPSTAMAVMVLVVCGPIVASCWGATPGQRIARVKVVNLGHSGPPMPGRALLRWAAGAVPLLVGAAALTWALWSGTEGTPGVWLAVASFGVWMLVHASVLWDPQRRGWRDKLAGTIVVRAPATASSQGLTDRRTSNAQDMDRRWREFMGRERAAAGEPDGRGAEGSQG
ncbi:RDD family protein [Candidatus Poriferisodalis sp.]|uniref:RDD family protein n=1 Tax=Candidatus Poriferisodalis sp. TaxID=3101277 RepID=UPI003B0136FE